MESDRLCSQPVPLQPLRRRRHRQLPARIRCVRQLLWVEVSLSSLAAQYHKHLQYFLADTRNVLLPYNNKTVRTGESYNNDKSDGFVSISCRQRREKQVTGCYKILNKGVYKRMEQPGQQPESYCCWPQSCCCCVQTPAHTHKINKSSQQREAHTARESMGLHEGSS